MSKSTHECVVVDIIKEKHPAADKLSVVFLWDKSYCVVINTEQWEGKTRGVFIPGQNYVDVTRPEFSFMSPMAKAGEKLALVKHCKLRGVKSDGILIPVPNDTPVGEDWTERLGVTHKEDEPEELQKETIGSPPGYNLSKYDIDGAKNFKQYFVLGEEVVCSIKVHGQNCKYLFQDGIMYCGGRTQWLKENKAAPIWAAYYNYPQIRKFCEENPKMVLWGECLMQKGYTYGFEPGYRGFFAFDIRKLTGEFLDYDDFLLLMSKYSIPTVKEIYRGPYSHDKVVELAENLPKEFNFEHEGVVCKPVKERQTRKFERLIYKVISSKFKG